MTSGTAESSSHWASSGPMPRRGGFTITTWGGPSPADSRIAQEVASSTRKRSEEHTSELQSRGHLVCRLLLEKKKKRNRNSNARDRRHKTQGNRSRLKTHTLTNQQLARI